VQIVTLGTGVFAGPGERATGSPGFLRSTSATGNRFAPV